MNRPFPKLSATLEFVLEVTIDAGGIYDGAFGGTVDDAVGGAAVGGVVGPQPIEAK